MADLKPNIERKESTSSREKQAPKEKESKEITEQRSEFVQGVEGVVEGTEGMEAGAENVSENVTEAKKRAPSSGGGKIQTETQNQSGAAAIAAPQLEVMRIQVHTRIKKEILALEKQASQLMKSRNLDAFNLTQLIAKIRRLREILSELATATADKIKSWWQEYVK